MPVRGANMDRLWLGRKVDDEKSSRFTSLISAFFLLKLSTCPMNFRSIAQLSDQLVQWSRRLPRDIDVIVGVPRSGLLVANILATYRNIPLAELDGFIEGRCYRTGHVKENALNAKDTEAHLSFLSKPRRVLVIDDTVSTGASLRSVRERIEAAGLPHTVEYAAVYTLPGKEDLVDYYCEVLTAPRIFEWNLFHHRSLLPQACVDMDGVLCANPSSREDDDGERYLSFLAETRPFMQPSAEIGWIVTSRLERYRAETEAWLAEHGVRYRELIMLDYPNAETRKEMRINGANKADVYRRTGAALFIESDIRQAVEIATLARREVLCIDTMQMIRPGTVPVPRPLKFGDESVPNLPRRIARKVIPRNARAQLLGLVRGSNHR
jgi:uncharacterized HAD superfamily protein/adenine/guanine phosphoribosyltransferase-like PRPP-binding protein